MSTFQYVEELKDSEIRLLRLHPGEWLEDLEATLYVADRSWQYTALSYAWGSTRTSNQIIVNSKLHGITFNLDRALRAIRRRTEPIVLWVDSICINQHDAYEKSHQVGLMHDIFGWATDVIAYLGDGLDRSRQDYLRRFEKLGQHSPVHFAGTRRDEALAYQYLADLWKKPAPGSISENDEIVSLFSFFVAFSFESMNDSFLDDQFTSLTKNHSTEDHRIQLMAERIRLFAISDWWNRMWIIQEACVAKNLTVAYGRATMPFSFIVDATENFLQLSSLRSKELNQVMSYLAEKVYAIDMMRFRGTFGDVAHVTTTSPLLWLLRRFRSRKSSEPRDKVFALLQLAQDLKKERVFKHSYVNIKANYDIYTSGLFTTVALEIILQTGLIWMTTVDLLAKTRKDIPSWVPDWSSENMAPGFDQRRFRLHGEIPLHFNASRAMFKERPVDRTALTGTTLVPRQHIERLVTTDDVSTWEPVHLRPTIYRYTKHPHASEDQQYRALVLNGVNCGLVETVSEVILSDLSNIGAAIAQTWPSYGMHNVWRIYRKPFLDVVAICLCYSLRVSSESGGRLHSLEPEEQRRVTVWVKQRYERHFFTTGNQATSDDSPGTYCLDTSAHPMPFEGTPAWTHESRALVDEIDILPKDFDLQKPLEADEIQWIEDTVRTMASGCRLFITERGQVGVGPENMRIGDEVCILEGGLMPYILRGYTGSIHFPSLQSGRFEHLGEVRRTTMVGSCFVEGTMHWGRGAGETEDDPQDIEHLDSKLRRRLFYGKIFEEGIAIL
ncbi:heterokaryon incompatibility protein [Colletotrichum tofieldiae]|uniref:Heterokaryon incompatibility protein n=1 Tax=Colletotrichum tofieldiae TaxID=708197 RepID=A0A166ZF98_9PEZI|nr:heterokaryon incompatibility protein [Colletotrichum tofieldiae]GKT55824.1 heterokaryon incompatibility protein [Colletotrichum tofieldiae]GKT82509.1 heterokaryon incompatibility protein [Colletotrichum tofieldiae]